MTPSRPVRLRRRGVLGFPALLTVAVAVAARPTAASAAPAAPKAECLADLIEQS